LFKQSLTIFENALGQDHPTVASSLMDLGSLYTNEGKYAEAESLEARAQTFLALSVHRKRLSPRKFPGRELAARNQKRRGRSGSGNASSSGAVGGRKVSGGTLL